MRIILASLILSALFLGTAFAQDEQVEDNYGTSVPNDSIDANNFDNSQPPNPDPEFMEQIEPGEYNQSDDTTELNDNY